MNNYFQKLSLPRVVLDPDDFLKIRRANINQSRPYVSILTDFHEIINPELIYVFKHINVVPNLMLIFGHENNINRVIKNFVHTDICYRNKQWIKIPFAINWEITNTSVDFKWYDVSDHKEIYPPITAAPDLNYLEASGIHYGERYMSGKINISETFNPIESVTLNQNEAIMVKTSLPHAVVYSGLLNRINVSLRFNITDIPTWESALIAFKPFIQS